MSTDNPDPTWNGFMYLIKNFKIGEKTLLKKLNTPLYLLFRLAL
jgi:hypothetical protein